MYWPAVWCPNRIPEFTLSKAKRIRRKAKIYSIDVLSHENLIRDLQIYIHELWHRGSFYNTKLFCMKYSLLLVAKPTRDNKKCEISDVISETQYACLFIGNKLRRASGKDLCWKKGNAKYTNIGIRNLNKNGIIV